MISRVYFLIKYFYGSVSEISGIEGGSYLESLIRYIRFLYKKFWSGVDYVFKFNRGFV